MNIILFGYGSYCIEFLNNKKSSMEIIAIADNNSKLWGKVINGKVIINPQDIIKYEYDYICIISMHYKEITKQLGLLNIKSNKIVSIYDIDNQIEEFDDYYIYSNKAYDNMNRIINERPVDINIETINKCPLKCSFCCNRKIYREKQVMSDKLFEKICKDYYEIGGGSIGISSMQSDVLSDPLLPKRIDCLNVFKDKFYIYTTTPLISLAKYSDEEVENILNTFDYLQISVEGTNKEDYELMSGVDAYDVFVEQIYRVKNIINTNKIDIRIDLYFRTYDIEKLKIDDTFIKLKELFPVNEIRNEFFSWFGSISEEELPKGAKIIRKNNTYESDNCVVPNITLSISPDGKSVGCGCIDWESKHIIGDCNEQSLKEIWKSKKAMDFRNAFQSNNIPNICVECALYESSKLVLSNKNLKNYKVTDGIYYNFK
ncbi:SPASM domain-containing protein [Clostridium saccharoperbutylacetonicum]|uniref:SPASM domain-containing protein n=1 Tax=Clostridium saccharoperbutylacetonicum TaxID=36745 RepID=UPI000983B4A7|nr:SPASM domain-containing protein [Clostridium saccharoperbutylacetonicum]AQR97003.1 coenzyme PQQ synthesis protein E [Clostridium saccharoperbutylacetonicum]NSB32882.1 MoaA/NifB/PqqE/SkfB family radical SAM enzyme [Clostridium saccharoperbutylacetonicum]